MSNTLLLIIKKELIDTFLKEERKKIMSLYYKTQTAFFLKEKPNLKTLVYSNYTCAQ